MHHVQIDLLIGHVRLTDRFEWDPNNVSLTPEEFARILAADLGTRRSMLIFFFFFWGGNRGCVP